MASSYSTERIAHANHNYEAYLYLFKAESDKFLDWAITTAYYSANHYAKGKIFPHSEKVNDQKLSFDDFEDYYNKLHQRSDRSLHNVLIDLAYKELPKEIAAAIKKLHDLSNTARYHDYKLSNHGSKPKLKKDLQSKIDKVKAHCSN